MKKRSASKMILSIALVVVLISSSLATATQTTAPSQGSGDYAIGSAFTTSYTNDTADAIDGGFFILAVYDSKGVLTYLERQDLTAAVDETVAATFDLAVRQYPVSEYSYRVFYWDDDLTPLAEPRSLPDNLALRRAGYQSSAVDEFNTVTLVSDGIVSEPKEGRFSDGAWTAITRYYREWIYVDLGGPTALSSVGVDWGDSYAIRYQIQTSDDAVNWTSRVHKGSNAYSGGSGGTANAQGTPTAPWAGSLQTDEMPGGITARYVRILCESCSGGASGETYVIDGVNINGNAVDKYYAPSGFDSFWQSESDEQEWVYVDLGADSSLLGAKVVWGGNYATDYAIQISNDAKTWTTAATASGAADSAVASDLSGSARYVRLLCNTSSGDNYMVKELEVYGFNDLDYGLEPMPAPEADGKQLLRGGNWRLERASEVKADGFALSQRGFDDTSWLPATVPSTTLASYINAGAVPDPYYDMNNYTISDTFFSSDFWYRNSFEVPASQQGKDVWLNFDAINYRADVYINGHLLPNALEHRTRSIEGGFIRGKFDVTDYVNFGGKNYLAVFVQMNDTPWSYTFTAPYVAAPGSIGGATTIGAYITRYTTQQGLAFGPWPNGGNIGIDNPTFHAAAGWDWMPTIRGRDTGIYRDVFLSYTGGVEMIDPWMVTDLDIEELPRDITASPLALTPTVTQPGGQNGTGLGYMFDGDRTTQWLGDANAANPGFTLEFPADVTANAIVINWGEVIPAAAYETQNAKSFKIEVSEDGETWRYYDARVAGTGTGQNNYPAYSGTESYEGGNIINMISGPTNPNNGNAIARPFKYLRFTVLEKMTSVNSGQGVIPPKIQDFECFSQTAAAIIQGGFRKYELHDEQADLTFKTEVKNNTDAAVDATVSGVITPGNLSFTKTVSVPANRTVQVDVEDIVMNNPQLWWPNTYGDQPLYTVNAQLRVGGGVSDVKSFKFGVREFAYPTDSNAANRLAIYCNGTFIIAKGGNWGMDDALQMDTPERYDDKVRLHAEENMTMIRNWVGQTNNDAFYDACDKYGIMVWDDFWLANPYDGPNPKDRALFSENAIDRVKRTRSHAALTVYCGRNESNPPADLIASLNSITSDYDGTRFYFNNSAGAPVGSGGGYSLADYNATGNTQGPKNYFNNVSNNVLRSERGIPNVPSIQSIQKFVAPENQWPISDVWGHHDWTYFMNGPANTYMNALKSYMPALTYTFPAARIPGVSGQNPDPLLPAVQDYKNTFTPMLQELADKYTLQDFHDVAQLINLENHKALFQALTVTRANGLLMWMSQSSWPSFMWQTYDYYLDTNGGYFGTKAGNQPTQPVWDPRNDNITLCNYTARPYTGLTTALTIYDLTGSVVTTETYSTPSLASNAYGVRLDTITDKLAESPTDMVFIKLVLRDSRGEVLGENIYWHNKTTYLANQALTTLADADLTATASKQRVLDNGNVAYTITVKNDTAVPAVQTRIRTISEVTGEDILPTFYSDNYFTLMPGDTKVITAEFNPKYLAGGGSRFTLSGWNTVEETVAAEAPTLGNLALRRAGYQSSAVDEFNTVTLVSDGIVSEPKEGRFSDGAWTALTRYYREWIYVDLGEPTALNSVGVDWGDSYAVRYQIQTSDDAVNWTSRVYKGSNAYSGGGGGTANAQGTPTAPWGGSLQTDEIPGGVTARYVRILCESCSGGASGETYVIDGVRVNGSPADKYYTPSGFDSFWQSESGGQEWVYVDLGADSVLTGAKVVWGGNYATDYAIQISDDAETWTTAATASGAADSAVASDLSGSARYVRLLCNTSSGDNYMVKELEVYGFNDLDYELEPMPAPEADGTQQLRGGNWRLERASEVKADGFALSQRGFDDASWLPATVPSTTLASYINAGAVPDPYYDMNNLAISDTFFTSDFWYRNSFEVPASQQGKDVWLNFDAINYRADVYFNGHLLPNALEHRTRSIEGGFIRGKFDVTDYVNFGGRNYLAVFIQMNDTPWCYTDNNSPNPPNTAGLATTVGNYITRYVTNQYLNAGPWPNGGNIGIDNPTFHAAAGWDWMPTVRGRDTGIYRDVFLSYTGGVEMIDPWMVTDLDIEELPTEYNVVPIDVAGAVVTQPDGQSGAGLDKIFDDDMSTYWLGDNSTESPGFTVALPEEITTNAMLIEWGEVEPAAAFETQHAKSFKLEVSTDGTEWENYGAHPAGNLEFWGMEFPYPEDAGPSSYDGAITNNLIAGPNGNIFGFLPFTLPKTFKYLRFTTLEKMTSVNSDQGVVAPKIRQINFYGETRDEIEGSVLRNYVLHDEQADLTFKTEVKNNTNAAVDATVSGVITPGNLSFTKTVSVPANQTVQVDVEDIIMNNPQLWWPNTYGDQPLYTADVQLKLGESVSDVKSFKFGVREFSYPIDGGRLGIYCNGSWIIAKGGNWGMDDALQMDTPERYDDKVRLHAEENMTMIRNWVGQTNNDAFYDACDKYGIMVWDDFWLANPYDGPDPKDRALFSENAIDRVKRTRTHASLTVYCGRNESNPPADLVASLTDITDDYDGTRFYFNNSAGAPVGSGGGYSIADYNAGGDSQGPKNYFSNVSNNVLRSERGIPNVPSLQSIQKFVAPKNQWPISESWAHHDWTYMMNGPANTYMNALKSYMPKIAWTFPNSPGGDQNQSPETEIMQNYRETYTPMLEQLADWYTLEDFHNAAQMINLENHKALFQALTVTRANGLLMWMSQSSWPSFMWQTYDYYLDTNGGYFGTKAGNQPTQPVWDPRNDNITLCNFTTRPYTDVTTTLTVYDLNGGVVAAETYSTPSLASNAYGVRLDTITAKLAESPTDMVFIKLVLKDSRGEVLGENIYWHNKTTYLANQALTTLADADLTASVLGQRVLENGNVEYTITVKNDTAVPAVQTRIRTISEVTGEDVLPAFYSDNYFTLMPGDTKVVTVEFNPKYLEGGGNRFTLSGWNTVAETVA